MSIYTGRQIHFWIWIEQTRWTQAANAMWVPKTSMDFDDKIEIAVSVEEFKGVKLILKYIMKNIDTNQLVLIGKTKHCFLDKNNKPTILKKHFPEVASILEELSIN